MSNIEYLEKFFKKHNLSGKIKVRYDYPIPNDEYISIITFEDGTQMNINDVIFDIDSNLDTSFTKRWMEDKKTNNISLVDWFVQNTNYVPDIDRSSVEDFQKTMESLVDNINMGIDRLFSLDVDGDSDWDEENNEDED